MTKTCKGCGECRRIPDDFYPSRPNKCRACVNADAVAWREAHAEKVVQYQVDYQARERAKRIAAVGERFCAQCDGLIPQERPIGTKYCERDCWLKAAEDRRKARRDKAREGRNCEHCGDGIPAWRTLKAKYCRDACLDAASEVQRHHRMTRRLSYYAIEVGRLVKRPCEVCGDPDVQIHHVDYFEPLNVRFLCFRHHMEDGHGWAVHTVKE